jgi:hypothetical protein
MRVRREFPQLLVRLGSPASAPKPAGCPPGRPKGRCSGPATRYPAIKKPAKKPQNKQTKAWSNPLGRLVASSAVALNARRRAAWSTSGEHAIGSERIATVSSGTSFALVAGAILGKQARVENPEGTPGK